ncbi:DUF4391 domain-containing protein [Bacillus wiedmannii]|uniref:DUF4391 domain-containing protein n=1 Tax=Bacillus wiedmannii TaxID=1890302 RepID=UPI0007DB54AC|nr:DUF4391 domain-containing protein [Bacillus wiedmannii]OAK46939.1 hypothetical protein A6285_15415 [Bacillus wiedmannii]HDR7661447.1 DUF4391 domain-containing protein [Bacillus wiedmannii]
MREWFIQRLDMPNRIVLNRKIPKKAFFTQGDLSASEKELFTSQIEGIYLLSVMNQQSMNIPVYQTDEFHYAEVVWIYIKLRASQNINRIVNAVHKSIPNPVVLIVESSEGELLLSTCHKRVNKNDMTKVVVDQPTITKWFQPNEENGTYNKLLNELAVEKLSFENLYNIYDDIHQWLQCEEVILLIGTLPTGIESRKKVVNVLYTIHEHRKEVERLQKEQKGQLDFGEKMELHMKIKRQEQQISAQLQQMKELC